MDPEHMAALLANASAQLRGPMSSLYMAISRIAPASARRQDPDLDARAAALDQSYYQLLRLVNNLSAFQALESGKPMRMRDQDLAAFAAGIFGQVEPLARCRPLTLRFLCPMEHLTCAFCAEGLREMLFQLLSNAFKFTPPGGEITLEAGVSKGQILLAVADTGPGIPPQERLSLFSRWRMEEESFPPHGIGLGLAICQGIARAHDGVLSLDAGTTQGCRFVFTMPRRLVGPSGRLSDVRRDYSGGFDPCLVALSDALPPNAFHAR